MNHERPDGERCSVAAVGGRNCLRCGAFVSLQKARQDQQVGRAPNRVEAKAEVLKSEPKADREPEPIFDFAVSGEVIEELRRDVRQAPTWLILEVLEARGAELGYLEVGGVQGCVVLLGPRAHERPVETSRRG
jgi:hypothetical protein